MDRRISDSGNGKNGQPTTPPPTGSSASGETPQFRSAKLSGQQPVFLQQPSSFDDVSKNSQITPNQPVQAGWNDPVPTMVGLYYPLGPCLIHLAEDSLQDVLQTLPEVFRRLSLHAIYQDSPIKATCRSLDQIEFEVSIFKSRTNQQEISIEIERKDGDVVQYHNYGREIVKALTGTAFGFEVGQSGTPCFWSRNVLEQADSVGDVGNESIVAALEGTWGLISTDRYDARRLGFESLVHMTDPYKSGFSVARTSTESLLSPKDVAQERVSRALFGYATKDTPAEQFHSLSSAPFFGGATDADFSYLALIVVAQILQVAAECQMASAVETFLSTCPNDLVECILQKMQNVHSHPHQAFYAVQSLAALCEVVPSLRSRINGRDVEEAQLFGNSCHQALATASNKLLLALQA